MELRREIREGLNVIENWNSTNNLIFFGKGGEMAYNRADDQEMNILVLQLLQLSLALVPINNRFKFNPPPDRKMYRRKWDLLHRWCNLQGGGALSGCYGTYMTLRVRINARSLRLLQILR